MNMEIIEKKRRADKLAMIKSCAKALNLIGNIEQMFLYLDTLVDAEWINEDEETQIACAISKECKDITWGEIRELREKF